MVFVPRSLQHACGGPSSARRQRRQLCNDGLHGSFRYSGSHFLFAPLPSGSWPHYPFRPFLWRCRRFVRRLAIAGRRRGHFGQRLHFVRKYDEARDHSSCSGPRTLLLGSPGFEVGRFEVGRFARRRVGGRPDLLPADRRLAEQREGRRAARDSRDQVSDSFHRRGSRSHLPPGEHTSDVRRSAKSPKGSTDRAQRRPRLDLRSSSASVRGHSKALS
jgi:hypothetical protein